MSKRVRIVICVTVALSLGIAIGVQLRDSQLPMPAAHAAGGKVKSPTGTAPDRYVYYPGTESLAPDEIRIVACGTGMPAARRGQAASCWVFELGNGDKFLFDLGTGSMANVMSLMIPANMLNKMFASHLHTDHIGDLAPCGRAAGPVGVRRRWRSGDRAARARTWAPPTSSTTSSRLTTGTT